jgi:hypothetical protein
MSAKSCVEGCVSDIKLWMSENMLLQNDSKTNYLVVASAFHFPKTILPTLNIGGHEILPSKSAKNLGAIFDKHLDMDDQILHK